MTQTLTVTYDEAILRKGTMAFVGNRLCRGFGYLGYAAILLLLPSLWLGDAFGWFQIFLLAVLGFVVLVFLLSYWASLRLKLARFRQMQSPDVEMTLREGGFDVTSSLGTATQPWSYLTGIVKKKDFWLLFGPKVEFIVLPTKGVSPEALHFLEQKVTAAP